MLSLLALRVFTDPYRWKNLELWSWSPIEMAMMEVETRMTVHDSSAASRCKTSKKPIFIKKNCRESISSYWKNMEKALCVCLFFNMQLAIYRSSQTWIRLTGSLGTAEQRFPTAGTARPARDTARSNTMAVATHSGGGWSSKKNPGAAQLRRSEKLNVAM